MLVLLGLGGRYAHWRERCMARYQAAAEPGRYMLGGMVAMDDAALDH